MSAEAQAASSRSRLLVGERLVPEIEAVERAFADNAFNLRNEAVRRVPQVLDVIRDPLGLAGWRVARGSRASHGIPIQTAPSGRVRADGAHRSGRAALWIETGRSWTNNAFLLHIVE